MDDKAIDDQCILAKNNGIDGFYIFLYDFSNNIHPLYKIIPKLIKILTRHGLEFCFMWANEPWSRRWDGSEHDVLLKQDKVVSKIQIELFVKRIVNFVKQKNYLTVDGKKFFTIYRPGYFDNLDQVIIDFKKEFQKYNLNIHLSGCNTFSTSQKILSKMDSIVEYPPHLLDLNVNYHFKSINENRTNIWCYKKFILFYINYLNFFKSNKRIFRTAFASWDNTPRKGKDSNLYVNYSRANFIKLLSSIFSSELKNNYKEKIIFINSWNEWGEGAHIEPDKQFGFWKLNVINEIKSNYQNSLIHNSNSVEKFYTDNINLALIHVYDPKHYKFIIDFANKFKKIDFYVTIPMFVFNFKLEKNFKNLIIKFVHNEDRDFNILYHSKKILEKSKYKIISKIHFKGRDQTNNFYMGENISYKIVEEQLLLNNSLLGAYNTKNNHIYFKKNWMLKNQKDYLGNNEKNLKDFANKNNFNFEEFLNTKFLSGGIWTLIDNSDSLLEVVNLIDKVKFTLDNFHIPNDGKYLHTLERFTLPFFLKKSFELKYI